MFVSFYVCIFVVVVVGSNFALLNISNHFKINDIRKLLFFKE